MMSLHSCFVYVLFSFFFCYIRALPTWLSFRVLGGWVASHQHLTPYWLTNFIFFLLLLQSQDTRS